MMIKDIRVVSVIKHNNYKHQYMLTQQNIQDYVHMSVPYPDALMCIRTASCMPN